MPEKNQPAVPITGDDEDKRDGAIARNRLAEAKRDPSKLVRGKALEDELARLLKMPSSLRRR